MVVCAAGSMRVATAQTDFSLPWPGLVFSLSRPQPSDSARETRKADPFPAPCPGPFGLMPGLSRDNQTGIPLPRGLRLTPQGFSSHPSLPRRPPARPRLPLPCGQQLWAQRVLRALSLTLARTRTLPPSPFQGEERARRMLACMPVPSTQALGTRQGRLPPGTSQLWLLVGGHRCRPSH